MNFIFTEDRPHGFIHDTLIVVLFTHFDDYDAILPATNLQLNATNRKSVFEWREKKYSADINMYVSCQFQWISTDVNVYDGVCVSVCSSTQCYAALRVSDRDVVVL